MHALILVSDLPITFALRKANVAEKERACSRYSVQGARGVCWRTIRDLAGEDHSFVPSTTVRNTLQAQRKGRRISLYLVCSALLVVRVSTSAHQATPLPYSLGRVREVLTTTPFAPILANIPD